MPETLATIKTKVSLVIMDVASFVGTGTNQEMESAIREAIEEYSHDIPREIVTDIAGDGTTYDLTLPDTYSDRFSRIVNVEYPAGERVPVYIDGNDWIIYRTSTTTRLRLLVDTPATGKTTRITFTAPHTLDTLDSATATTIPSYHTHAFVNLAAAQGLYRMAARLVHEQESTLNADAVDRNSKSADIARIAGALRRRYQEAVGTTSGEQPATVVRDWDYPVHQGLFGLTHRRRVV